MRIAILNLTAGGMSGGYKKYLLHIIPRMIAHPAVSKIYCISSSALHVEKWFEPHSKAEFIGISRTPVMGLSLPYRSLLEQYKPDVVYIPVERFVHCGNMPVVNMLQNMEPFIYPSRGYPAAEKVKNRLRAMIAKKAVLRADRVIGISEFVRGYLVETLGVPRDKVGLVYHGIDLNYHITEPVPPETAKCLPGEAFLFTAGSIRPARGIEDLVHALSVLKQSGIIANLFIAGSVDPGMHPYKSHIDKISAKQEVSSQITWTGPLSQGQMAWYYTNCDVFSMTSRAEACPNVVLETMAHGCISVSSKTGPMPEIYGDAALFYTPGDGQMLAGVIREALSFTRSDRLDFSERARLRASAFSWDVCANKTVEELHKAIEDYR